MSGQRKKKGVSASYLQNWTGFVRQNWHLSDAAFFPKKPATLMHGADVFKQTVP